MHADILLIILLTLVVLCGIIAIAWWRYLPPEDLPGPEGTFVVKANRAGESDWGDELHAINQAIYQDRAVAQLTHYEVEAVIRRLGVPEWVPERLRLAA